MHTKETHQRSRKKKAVVYWIHYEEHNDPKTQGYIGITTSLPKRMNKHKSGVTGKHVFNRLMKGAVVEVLHECETLDDAALIEKEYRPEPMIGWNLAAGGDVPPPRTGKVNPKTKLKGEQRTEAQKRATRALAEKNRGRQSPRKGVSLSQETKEKLGKSVTINNKTYATYTEAAKDLNVDVSQITKWVKEKRKEVLLRKNGMRLIFKWM